MYYVFVSECVLKCQQINHSETFITFSMFFDMSFQENVKNAFLNFEKKRKIRILEQCS